jgi:uncharacterized protein YqhQ
MKNMKIFNSALGGKSADGAIKPTSIGGQAVIEGVMMAGPGERATAVRKKSGEIVIDKKPNNTFISRYKLNKIPILRGFLAFFVSMFTGVSCLMFAAKEYDLEDGDYEMSKFEKYIMEKFGDKLFDIVMYVSVFFSLIIGVGFFMILPKLAVEYAGKLFGGVNETVSIIIEGVIRIALFVVYILLISKMKDIRRVFEYHGAEHKTIFAYEHGEELTVENVRKYKRFHPRCGTSFLVIVMIVSIIVFFFIRTDTITQKILWRIALLPVVAGLSYEIIKLAGRYNNPVTRFVSAPGIWLQNVTTNEPDDSQIEVAIAALKAVIPENANDAKW